MDYYQINQSRVIFEILNSEVIVVNFSTGDYFSLMHSAKPIWQLLDKGVTVSNIASLLAAHYQQDLTALTNDLNPFIEELLKEELIIPTVGERLPSEIRDLLSADLNLTCDYTPPIIHKYSDVQNLLKIDPVHDVTAAGWPNMPSTFEQTA